MNILRIKHNIKSWKLESTIIINKLVKIKIMNEIMIGFI